jgi:hypothetical protein
LNIYFTILFSFLLLFFYLKKQWNSLLFFTILSLNGSLFYYYFFGTRILFIHIITFIALFFTYKIYRKRSFLTFGGIYLEFLFLIILAFYYSLINPWVTPSQIWSEQPIGRSVVALSRFLMEISVMFFFCYIIWKGKSNIKKILNIVSFVVILNSLVAIIDWLSKKYFISKFLFDWNDIGWDLISTRILGFSNEPRIFGRLMVFSWFVLYYFKQAGYKIKYIKFSLSIGLFLLLITLSFSSYILFTILFLVSVIIKLKFNKKNILIISILMFLLIVVINLPEFDALSDIYYKIEMISSGRSMQQMDGEPLFFTRFELFDRVALNHLYNNPINILTGTGPNLISIPASKYMDKSGQLQFGETINMIPGVGIINLISRSGLIGLFLFSLSFYKLTKKLKESYNNNLVGLNIINFLGFLIVSTPAFYFINGILLGLIYKEKYSNIKTQHDINNYSSL